MLTRLPPVPRTRTIGGRRVAPKCGLRRPQPLACFVLEADVGGRARAVLLSPATPRPSTPRPVSSRSIACRTGTSAGRPAVRAHQLRGPLHGVTAVDQAADQRLDPAQRPRWSLTNPCASGPFRSSPSSRAHWWGSAAPAIPAPGPQRLRAAVAPGPGRTYGRGWAARPRMRESTIPHTLCTMLLRWVVFKSH